MALTCGLTRSIWATCACMTSNAETSRRRIIAASSFAVRKHSSWADMGEGFFVKRVSVATMPVCRRIDKPAGGTTGAHGADR
jgi:hypothetical protein